MSIVSAAPMAIAILLTIIFMGITGRNPANMPVGGAPVTIHVFAPPGTTFVDGFNAFLNVTFLWIGYVIVLGFLQNIPVPR